jgi:hypothetical protein
MEGGAIGSMAVLNEWRARVETGRVCELMSSWEIIGKFGFLQG